MNYYVHKLNRLSLIWKHFNMESCFFLLLFFLFIFIYSHELAEDFMSSLGLKIDFQKKSIKFFISNDFISNYHIFCFSPERDEKSHSLASTHTQINVVRIVSINVINFLLSDTPYKIWYFFIFSILIKNKSRWP